MACKGSLVSDITVGDCVELVDTQRRVHSSGGQRKVDFYLRLRAVGTFPADAPATIRAFGLAQGQVTVEDLVDRYRLQRKPVRDLLVDYLKERQPALYYASLDSVARSLAGLFWARIEALSPGIESLHLPPDIARAWKEDVLTIKRSVTGPDGNTTVVTRPRINARDELIRVRRPSTSTSPSGPRRSPGAGRSGPCPAPSAPATSSTRNRNHEPRPAWTPGPASGSPSCPPSPPPPTAPAPTPPHAECRPRHQARRAFHRRRAAVPPRRHPEAHPPRLGRGPRHRQPPRPDPRGGQRVLGLGRHRSPAPRQFPPRPAREPWPATAQDQDEVLRLLTSPPFLPRVKATQAGRRRGTAKLLRWLSSFPGDTWQQRWEASGSEEHPGSSWASLPLGWLRDNGLWASYDENDLSSGLLMLICGDVIRPRMTWMVTRAHRHLAPVMAETRDPAGFARLRELAEAGPAPALKDARLADTRIATILACKGGVISDITVGDCVEMSDAQRLIHSRGGQKKVDFYLRLHALGIFPADAPATIRAFGMAMGRVTVEELVDRYQLQCKPVRDLLVDYLKERQPALDYASLDSVSRTLAGLFWARVEALSPGVDTLRLPPEVARAWKDDVRTIKRSVTGPDGNTTVVTRPRINAKDELIRVRALYLDIAQWAMEEPERWAQWAVPSPVTDAEINWAKERRRRKARMDQRTRERLPVLPVLARTAADRKNATARHLQAAVTTPPGEIIDGTAGTLRRAVTPTANGRHVWAEDTAAGKRRNLSYEEEEAFWAFATIEVLRLTGIRCEELLELTHHGITEYRLPTTGELVPLLQIAPSKTDTERLLLVSPELADVLSAVISRLRGPGGAVPLTVSYDVRERVWNPPMPLLFQRSIGSENRPFTPSAIRKLLIGALAATGLADGAGDPLMFSPHDFRRILSA